MIDFGPYAPSPALVVVFGILALVGGCFMFRRGHNYMVIPVMFSIGWITLGYIGYWARGLDTDDLGFFVRSGLLVLFISMIVGAGVLIRARQT